MKSLSILLPDQRQLHGGGGCVIDPVCLFVCQEDYCKSNQPVSLKLDVIVVLHTSQKNRSISGGDLFSLFPRIAELGILEGLLAFLIQSPAAFHEI